MALSTAIFPILFGRAAAGDSGGYARTLLRAVKTVLLVALPAGVGLVVLRECECDFPWHNARACMRLIDQMRGQDFERFLDLMFRRLGYKTILTPELKDHGADVILIDSNGRKIAVQAKKLRYSKNRVGVKALGELYRGMKWYGCDGGIVITNQYFTDQAIEEARKFGIALWDRPQIIKLIKETHNRSGVAGGT
jgi:restriction system protein